MANGQADRGGNTGATRQRALGAVEGCVLQLAAAINATPGQRAQFTPEQPKAVAKSPSYRADVATLAAMFRFCLQPKERTDKERASAAPSASICCPTYARRWRPGRGRRSCST